MTLAWESQHFASQIHFLVIIKMLVHNGNDMSSGPKTARNKGILGELGAGQVEFALNEERETDGKDFLGQLFSTF